MYNERTADGSLAKSRQPAGRYGRPQTLLKQKAATEISVTASVSHVSKPLLRYYRRGNAQLPELQGGNGRGRVYHHVAAGVVFGKGDEVPDAV